MDHLNERVPDLLVRQGSIFNQDTVCVIFKRNYLYFADLKLVFYYNVGHLQVLSLKCSFLCFLQAFLVFRSICCKTFLKQLN